MSLKNIQEKFDLLIDIELKDKTWIKEKIQELIKEDPKYFESYIYLYNLYLELEDYSECEKVLFEGYNQALKLILNDNKL